MLNLIRKAILRKKSLDSFSGEGSVNTQSLKRTLGLSDIILYGIGCSVGAGIYSLVGIGATIAGPAISFSFLFCGIACIFTSFSYAELAGRIPVAGSAYAFTYVAFGELAAWLVGWNMTLGYGISSAVVARSWAEYLASFISHAVQSQKVKEIMHLLVSAPIPFVPENDYRCAPLAIIIVLVCTLILVFGAKVSSTFNNIITVVNISMLVLVVILGIASNSIEADNLEPFMPYGIAGIGRGSGFVFFAYLGFDMVSCLSEEVKNPQQNMPKGIVGSLLASMSIYISVALVVIGIAPIKILGSDVPIVNALLANACCDHKEQLLKNAVETCLDTELCSENIHNKILFYGSHIVSFGALFGLTTSTFTGLMGQPRIFYSMAKDGLLFDIFGQLNEETGIPMAGTLITGFFVATIACFMDLEVLADIISIGTLQVFSFVCAGVLILRKNEYDRITNASFEETPGLIIAMRDKVILWILLCSLSALTMSISISQDWNQLYTIVSIILVLFGSVCLHFVPYAALNKSFNCPFVPSIPLLGIITNSYMIGSLPMSSWFGLGVWLFVGVLVYFCYGMWNSRLVHVTEPQNIHTEHVSLTLDSKSCENRVYGTSEI